MPREMGQIRVMLSSRVVFNLDKEHDLYMKDGQKAYETHMYKNRKKPLKPGPLFGFAKSLLSLNDNHKTKDKPPVVELGIYCKDTMKSAERICNSTIQTGIRPHLFINTCGKSVDDKMHKAFQTDLFLSRNAKDVQYSVDLDISAATIHFPKKTNYTHNPSPLQIIVDGDAVMFGSASEARFKEMMEENKAIADYVAAEYSDMGQKPEPGPFTNFLQKISKLNMAFEQPPFEIGLMTARNQEAAVRAMDIANQMGIVFNSPSLYLGGAEKAQFLKTMKPDLFLDDQELHTEPASLHCPTGRVPYKTGSAMHTYLMHKNGQNMTEGSVLPPHPKTGQYKLNI